MIRLYDYQTEAVDAALREYRAGRRRTATVLPTGGGKTIVFAELIRRRDAWRRREGRPGRSLVLAHRIELVEQAVERLYDVAPDLRVGVVKAQRNQTTSPVIVGSVATLASERRRAMLRDVDFIIVDECHHVVAPSYMATLRHFGAFSPTGALVGGYTATLTRGDEVGLGEVWQSVAYRKDIAWMVAHGYLVRPVGKHVEVSDLDLRGVRKSGGDYRDGDLGVALERSMAPELIAKAYAEHGRRDDGSFRPAIAFGPTVLSAQVIGEALKGVGARVGHVNGETGSEERRETLLSLRNGSLDIVTNCGVLTEGTDIPPVSCIIIARPTLQVGLFIQMAGRGLRLHPGKTDCLILDVVGATARHSLIAPVELFGDAPKEHVEPTQTGEPEVDVPVDLDEAMPGAERPQYANGRLVVTEVDLFHASHSAWLTTNGGVWFLPAGQHRYIALLPSRARDGYWDVVALSRNRAERDRYPARWIATGVSDQAYAMAHAEGDEDVIGSALSRRKSAWKRREPSSALIGLARSCGIVVTPDMTAGQVSGMVDVVRGSARIDPPLRGWYS